MSEFKPLLDASSDANDMERAVLRAGLDANPAAAQKAEVWAGILGALALTPPGVATAHGAALKVGASGTKAGAVWLGVGKGFVIGLALYGAAAGVKEVSERASAQHTRSAERPLVNLPPRAPLGDEPRATPSSAPPTPSESAVASAGTVTRSTPPSAAVDPEGPPSLRVSEAPSVAVFDDAPRNAGDANAQRSRRLEGEARALRAARSQLRAGQLADAFATLEASRRQFSAPELDQEREALMIELLHRSGQIAVARDRAKAFLGRYPESPHAGHVRQFMTP